MSRARHVRLAVENKHHMLRLDRFLVALVPNLQHSMIGKLIRKREIEVEEPTVESLRRTAEGSEAGASSGMNMLRTPVTLSTRVRAGQAVLIPGFLERLVKSVPVVTEASSLPESLSTLSESSATHPISSESQTSSSTSASLTSSSSSSASSQSLIPTFTPMHPASTTLPPHQEAHYIRLAEEFNQWVMYETAHVIAINKPAGLAAQGGSRPRSPIGGYDSTGRKVVQPVGRAVDVDAYLDAIGALGRKRPRSKAYEEYCAEQYRLGRSVDDEHGRQQRAATESGTSDNETKQGREGEEQENEDDLSIPERPCLVHRLDRDCSGVMLIAKSRIAALLLSEQFKKSTRDGLSSQASTGPFAGAGQDSKRASLSTGAGALHVINESIHKTYWAITSPVSPYFSSSSLNKNAPHSPFVSSLAPGFEESWALDALASFSGSTPTPFSSSSSAAQRPKGFAISLGLVELPTNAEGIKRYGSFTVPATSAAAAAAVTSTSSSTSGNSANSSPRTWLNAGSVGTLASSPSSSSSSTTISDASVDTATRPCRSLVVELGRYGNMCSLVALSPLTGRKHQLRVHCAAMEGLQAPILGDSKYRWQTSLIGNPTPPPPSAASLSPAARRSLAARQTTQRTSSLSADFADRLAVDSALVSSVQQHILDASLFNVGKSGARAFELARGVMSNLHLHCRSLTFTEPDVEGYITNKASSNIVANVSNHGGNEHEGDSSAPSSPTPPPPSPVEQRTSPPRRVTVVAPLPQHMEVLLKAANIQAPTVSQPIVSVSHA